MATNRNVSATFIVKGRTEDLKASKTETDKLAASVDSLSESYKEIVEAQRNVRAELQKLDDAGEQTGEEWTQLHADLDRLSTTMLRQREAARRMTNALLESKDATLEQRAAALKLKEAYQDETEAAGRANEEIRESKDVLQVHEQAVRQSAIQMERLSQETKKEYVAAKSTARVTQELSDAQERAARTTTRWGVATEDLKKSLVTAVAAGGVAGIVFKGISMIGEGFQRASRAVIEFQQAATESFSKLQEEVARTVAQVPELIQSQEELYESAVITARELGRAPLETQVAIRKAMNLGLEYNEAISAVEVATTSARIANADMTETLITGMSAVNAYGEGVYDINEVLDQYAFITQNSNLETQDLITGMAKIISPAAEAGVGIDEVSAAMVTMSRQGDDFKEIGDLLGLTLTQLAIRGTVLGDAFMAASGVGFREFTAAGGTLVDALKLLEQHAKDTDVSISELVIAGSKFYRDTQAGRGILELTGRHLGEFEEALDGAGKATGTLDKQILEFEGTLYLATEQMNSAKEAAWAMEGSLTRTAAIDWVDFKTNLYDLASDISFTALAMADYNELAQQSKDSFFSGGAEGNAIKFWQFRQLTQNNYNDSLLEGLNDQQLVVEMRRQEKIQLEIIKGIMEDNAGISIDNLEIEFKRLLAIIEIEERERKINEAKGATWLEQYAADRRSYQAKLDILNVSEEIVLTEEEIAEEAQKVAEELAAQEEAIRLAEQAAYDLLHRLDSIYTASLNIVTNISNLQTELAGATEAEDIAKLEEQITAANEAIQAGYRQTMVDAMLATYGYSESIIDLAVEMGLLTEDAGELEKDFIRITDAMDELANIEGFGDLGIAEQALAAEALADGLVRSAEEAWALVNPENWKEGVATGIVRAEEMFDIVPSVSIPPADQTKLDAFETQLDELVAEPYVTSIETAGVANSVEEVMSVRAELDLLEDQLITITVRTIYETLHQSNPDVKPPGGAGGLNFTVPTGYEADNYLIGVSSGERVQVTPAGQSASGSGLTLNVTNHFATGVHDQRGISSSVSTALYKALEEVGLT